MSERKVLNKYYPPDFDPAAIPRLKLGRDRQYTVRLMVPFNMRCLNCGDFIYKGKKFNARKETVLNETYLGLWIFRFYIRCPKCASEITFKTDPKNADYVAEQGATRNYEIWRLADQLQCDENEEEVEENPMKILEERTKESRKEMDILDGLEEIRDANARAHKVDLNKVIQSLDTVRRAEQNTCSPAPLPTEEEDEELIRKLFPKGKMANIELDDEDDEDASVVVPPASAPAAPVARKATDALIDGDGADADAAKRRKSEANPTWQKSVGKLIVDRKSLVAKPKPTTTMSRTSTTTSATFTTTDSTNTSTGSMSTTTKPSLASVLGDYGSDSNEDSS